MAQLIFIEWRNKVKYFFCLRYHCYFQEAVSFLLQGPLNFQSHLVLLLFVYLHSRLFTLRGKTKNFHFFLKLLAYMQLTLEQHRFELHESMYMQIFSVNTFETFLEIYDNLKIHFFPLVYSKNAKCNTHNIQNVLINCLRYW